jgi:hypothetical protein
VRIGKKRVRVPVVTLGACGDGAASCSICGSPAKKATLEGVVMKGFVQNIEGFAVKNDEFRRVLYTATSSMPAVFR